MPVLNQYKFKCWPVPHQYRWTTFIKVTFRSRAGGKTCLCQHYASTAPVLQILLLHWCGTKPIVNFHLGPDQSDFNNGRSNVPVLPDAGAVLSISTSAVLVPVLDDNALPVLAEYCLSVPGNI